MEGDEPHGGTEDQTCRREQPAEETRDRPNQNGRQNVARASRRGEASRPGEQRSRRSREPDEPADRLAIVVRWQCGADTCPDDQDDTKRRPVWIDTPRAQASGSGQPTQSLSCHAYKPALHAFHSSTPRGRTASCSSFPID